MLLSISFVFHRLVKQICNQTVHTLALTLGKCLDFGLAPLFHHDLYAVIGLFVVACGRRTLRLNIAHSTNPLTGYPIILYNSVMMYNYGIISLP